ncbi:MAG: hypothetical protein ACI4CY_08105 [Candidatus Gastranaerophilaceae bacterium]
MKKYNYIETLTDEMVKTRAEARKLTKEYFFSTTTTTKKNMKF